MKKVAILQSNYIPWKGYFDLINKVDEFIIYDDVQYTRRDWRNRNQIKSVNGPLWLTIPVKVKGKYDQKIKDTEITDPSWTEQHWKSIQLNYAKSKHFTAIGPQLKELYEISRNMTHLSQVNYMIIKKICELLNINTKITGSMEYEIIDGRSERLLDLCRQSGATIYMSGPSARNYLDESLFLNEGIAVEWMEYSGYPEYQQLYSPFVHTVSIIDLLLNVGCADAPNYMLTFQK